MDRSAAPVDSYSYRPIVLLVENLVLARTAHAAFLRGCGFEVVEAIGADEALTQLRDQRQIRVAFIDADLAGSKNGRDLARIIHKNHARVRVLLASSPGDSPPLDGVAVINKPYLLSDVERRIKSLIGKQASHPLDGVG